MTGTAATSDAMFDGSTTATVHVVNPAGLHARPCHALVSLALRHSAELVIQHGARRVNGKSILELMTLEAGQGSELVIEARGADADALVAALAALFRDGFGELDG